MHCRLCGQPTELRFTKRIMSDRDCGYWQCTGCRALQTEEPDWLDRSYSADRHGLGLDSASRSVWCQSLVVYLANVLRIRGPILDFGGGAGLLCRLLRDVGYDCYLYDRFTENIYAKPFEAEPGGKFAAVLAFEVFEHFADPRASAQQIFGAQPDFVVVGTDLYTGQGPDWYYIFPESGQHVFFWSLDAHRWVARQYGYEIVACGHKITVYAKQHVGPIGQTLTILCHWGAKATQVVLPLLGRPGLVSDVALIERKSIDTA